MQVEVNLAQKKQAGFVAGTRGGGGGGATGFTSATRFGDLKVNVEDLKELPLFKIVSAIGIGVVLNAYAESYKGDLIEKENVKMNSLRKKIGGIKKNEGRLKKFDKQRKRLEQDEQIIISKIETINKLVAARKFSIETLLFMSRSMPAEVWMTSFRILNNEVTISGEALKEEYVYQFMRKLNDGSFFENVDPTAITNSSMKVPAGEIEVTKFTLKAKQVRGNE